MALLSQVLAASIVRGEKGPTATVALGTVTTTTPAVGPSVTNTGSTGSAVFAFGLPRAATISYGTTTTVTPAVGPSASISTDGNGDKTLNISLPRAKAVSLGSVTTLSAGASASATTSTDANGDVTINFSIPQGAPGSISSVGNHVLPTVTNTYDLGSSTYRFRNIYVNDLQMSNGIGDYTIVEGEEDLFLYNNKNGKVYKFVIQEVDPTTVPPKAKTT
jgi:hypothetical protein